jgi:hypothetical protein
MRDPYLVALVRAVEAGDPSPPIWMSLTSATARVLDVLHRKRRRGARAQGSRGARDTATVAPAQRDRLPVIVEPGQATAIRKGEAAFAVSLLREADPTDDRPPSRWGFGE